ncbi:MAG: response regulator transcription factor [Anaerolineae bacterium]
MTAKILVVDDEPHIVRLVSFKLKKAGFDVLTAVNGQQALELTLSEQPALILLDVMLPDADGYAVCYQLKEQLGPQAPKIVLLSARSREIDILKGYESGADSYITKPFDPQNLLTSVEQILEE